MIRAEIAQCHGFVSALARLLSFGLTKGETSDALLHEAERLFGMALSVNLAAFRAAAETQFPVASLVSLMHESKGKLPPRARAALTKKLLRSQVERELNRLVTLTQYFSQKAVNYYLSKARELDAARVLDFRLAETGELYEEPVRLEVIDLASIKEHSHRLLFTSAALAAEWERVRVDWNLALRRAADNDERVPTFIVVDEAHNLIPAEPRDHNVRAVRDIFRTMVAEGRKYGVFLILVSQRPDKLDPLVVSECENKALMRLSGEAVLAQTRNLLGFEDVPERILGRTLDFSIGRVLLAGKWCRDGPVVAYSAARRTKEGGRNLRAEYWARP